MEFPCEQTDCILHSINNKSESQATSLNFDTQIKIWNVIFHKDPYSNSDLSLKFESYDLDIPFECLFCSYRKNINMKDEVAKWKAKNLLKGG